MSRPRAKLVDSREALRAFLAEIAGQERLAVDTEANPMHAYREQVCLIQVSAPNGDWLVDPLQDFDIGPLLRLLEDPAVTKVFHDAEYDILQLRRAYGIGLRGLWDTKVAALATGEESVGLSGLVERYFGVCLDKSLQRSDWGRRPLTGEQIDYAVLDVHYLLPLADLLLERIREGDEIVGLEIASELSRLEALRPQERSAEVPAWARVKGTRGMSPTELRSLHDLYAWRERQAERRDRPPFKIVSNGVLVALAKHAPRSKAELDRVRSVPKAVLRRWGDDIVAVLRSASKKDPLDRPAPPRQTRAERRRSEEDKVLHDALKKWRKSVADRRGTDPSLVLNREILERLARLRPRPRSRDELAATRLLEDWRIEAYGTAILDVMGAEA